MKFALYTISYSPHQIPLAKSLMKIFGESEYRYVSAQPTKEERRILGWGGDENIKWNIQEWKDREQARKVIESAEVLMCGERDCELLEQRCRQGLKTIYCSERWFKPFIGIFRLIKPSFLKMALKFVKLLRKNDKIYYFPIGLYAARDMARLCGLLSGDLRCLFKMPNLNFEHRPCGKIWLKDEPQEKSKKYCLDKMRIWGYFVEPTRYDNNEFSSLQSMPKRRKEIKILWVGRLLKLKRVDTIIRAVCELANRKNTNTQLSSITLDIYGNGPEEMPLKKMVQGYEDLIKFHTPVPISVVRKLMREHNIYVLASNGYEGWGAVVSEALEEGMKVIGTYEAGSTITILPSERLFHSGDWQALSILLEKESRDELPSCTVKNWNAARAAEYIVEWIDMI